MRSGVAARAVRRSERNAGYKSRQPRSTIQTPSASPRLKGTEFFWGKTYNNSPPSPSPTPSPTRRPLLLLPPAPNLPPHHRSATAPARGRQTQRHVRDLQDRDGEQRAEEGGCRVRDEGVEAPGEEREEEQRVGVRVEAREVRGEGVDGRGGWVGG